MDGFRMGSAAELHAVGSRGARCAERLALGALLVGLSLSAACSDSGSDTEGGAGGSGATAGTPAGGAGPTTGGTGGTTDGGSTGTGGSTDGGAANGGTAAVTPPAPDCDAAPSAAPAPEWVEARGNLNCGAVTLMAAQPCSSMVVAGLSDMGLWATTDGGELWFRLGTTGDEISNMPTRIIFDPETPSTFWESGIYGWQDPWTMGVFRTVNNGVSFKGYLNLSVIQSHQDSVSIDFVDPTRKTQMSGGHEQKRNMFVSTNAGSSFTDVGAAFPADIQSFCTNCFVVNADNLLVGCAASWSGADGAILRTTDLGQTFTTVSNEGVNGYALWATDNNIYWPAESGGLMKSTDLGESWAKLDDGSPGSQFASAQFPLELPDGRILSTDGTNIIASADQGATWSPIGQPLPSGNHFTYSAATKTFFSWGEGGCMKSGFDYEAN